VRPAARAMLRGSKPVVSCQTSGSNRRTLRCAARMAPKPRPRVQPYGALARRPTVRGRPSKKSAKADSAIAITSAITETVRMLTEASRIDARISESMADAARTPATRPKSRVLTAPLRS